MTSLRVVLHSDIQSMHAGLFKGPPISQICLILASSMVRLSNLWYRSIQIAETIGSHHDRTAILGLCGGGGKSLVMTNEAEFSIHISGHCMCNLAYQSLMRHQTEWLSSYFLGLSFGQFLPRSEHILLFSLPPDL